MAGLAGKTLLVANRSAAIRGYWNGRLVVMGGFHGWLVVAMRVASRKPPMIAATRARGVAIV
jgi:hypothetical protein